MSKDKNGFGEEFGLKKKSGFFDDYDTGKEEVVDVEIRQLVPFENHPFKVLEDESMAELMDSIKHHGVSVPIIVREKQRGIYEIIAGHRRSKACELLGVKKISAFVRELDEEEAVFQMVNTNIQREQLLPSEKAFAYKMKLEAMRKKNGRPEKNSTQIGQSLDKGKTTVELVAETSADSRNQIQRFIRLTELTLDFLDLVDSKKLPFNVAVELSYLTHTQQKQVEEKMDSLGMTPSLEQATKLKKYAKENTLTESLIESILTETKDKPKKISVKLDTSRFFSSQMTKGEIEEKITEILTDWKSRQGNS
ncbi:MAG: ParB/RepB/Spo0J family partition protein [Eubacteriales bacterium]